MVDPSVNQMGCCKLLYRGCGHQQGLAWAGQTAPLSCTSLCVMQVPRLLCAVVWSLWTILAQHQAHRKAIGKATSKALKGRTLSEVHRKAIST